MTRSEAVLMARVEDLDVRFRRMANLLREVIPPDSPKYQELQAICSDPQLEIKDHEGHHDEDT